MCRVKLTFIRCERALECFNRVQKQTEGSRVEAIKDSWQRGEWVVMVAWHGKCGGGRAVAGQLNE